MASHSRRYGPPLGSYRLQLHRAFTFADACKVIPYLSGLGVSHVYLSPIATAMPGSVHGYDVRDHGQVNPELGGLPGLYELHEALRAHDMGLILDVVPNHVGIGGDNPWWRDVLAYGQNSRFAAYFDIDWQAQPQMAVGVLVVPILGRSFGETLEAGELQLGFEGGEFVLRYFDNVLPIAPATYPEVLGLPPAELRDVLRDETAFASLVELLDELPRAERSRAEQLMAGWRELAASEPGVAGLARAAAQAMNGRPGEPATFDRLDALLAKQHYRLVNWRVAGEELNYRRFFDVNSLAGVRIEREEVFEEVHRLLFQLVARGIVTGVRVDHVDGLYDPAGYLDRLRARLDEAGWEAGASHVPIYVEKILEGDEQLPPEWPVDGTTGYEFAARVDQLLTDASGAAALDAAYREAIGFRPRFERTAYQARLQVAADSFAGEVNMLAMQLHRLAGRQRRWRDLTLRGMRHAVAGVLACFPVYRTYLGRGSDGQDGRSQVEQALHLARLRDPSLEGALDFLGEVLLLDGELEADERARRMHFRRRFEQLSGPIMAKGLEDTTLFRFNRLLSLNEVGGDPSHIGKPASSVHAWLANRARQWPHAMLATSTHDTKRSEDVRARLDVLSELGHDWRREAAAWRRINARQRQLVDGEEAPSPNAEYYLYQTLVGAWPEGPRGAEFTERITAHLLKAQREAKLETSWVRPNVAYEEACAAFVRAILGGRGPSAFARRVGGLVDRIRAAAAVNSLAALTLKVTAPGFPDFYQGTEGTALTLTDPDNRRPVDFAALGRLASGATSPVPPLTSAAAKPWLTRRLMALRAEYAGVFAHGSYSPLTATGEQSGRVFAFMREDGGQRLAVAFAIRALPMATEAGIPPGRWGDTGIVMPGGRWRDLISGAVSESGAMRCAAVFGPLPVAVMCEDLPRDG